MRDIFDEYTWNLSGQEDLNGWRHQTQKWYKTKRGWFLTTTEDHGSGIHHWFSTNSDSDLLPVWNLWDGETLPCDIIDAEANWDRSFDLIDIELAEMIMKGEL